MVLPFIFSLRLLSSRPLRELTCSVGATVHDKDETQYPNGEVGQRSRLTSARGAGHELLELYHQPADAMMLLTRVVDVNAPDREGNTALHLAARANQPASVAALKPAHPPSNPAKVFRAPSPRPSHRGEAPSATAPKKKAGLKPTRVRDGFG